MTVTVNVCQIPFGGDNGNVNGNAFILIHFLIDMVQQNIRAHHLSELPCAIVFNSFTYLEHGLLHSISYPVTGVNMSGHLCKFIGPRRWLPLGACPLWVRYCLLQFDSALCVLCRK